MNELQKNRAQIADLEQAIKASGHDLGEHPFPLEHFFIPGVYCRMLTMPPDSTITGMIHRYPQIVIFLQGEAVVSSEEGRRTIRAPEVYVSPPGAKRAIYTPIGCIMMTVHHTFQTDLEKIEQELIAPSFDDAALNEQLKQLEGG